MGCVHVCVQVWFLQHFVTDGAGGAFTLEWTDVMSQCHSQSVHTQVCPRFITEDMVGISVPIRKIMIVFFQRKCFHCVAVACLRAVVTRVVLGQVYFPTAVLIRYGGRDSRFHMFSLQSTGQMSDL